MTGALVFVLAIIGTIDGIVATAGLDLTGLPMSLGLAVYLASSAVLGVVRIVAWGYLAAMAWRGAFAGESPASGWRLASIGAGLVILALVIIDLRRDRRIRRHQPGLELPHHRRLLGRERPAAGSVHRRAAIAGRPRGSRRTATTRTTRTTRKTRTTKTPETRTTTSRPTRPRQARSVGSALTRLRRKLRPSSTCSVGAYGPGIRKHGRPASATPGR